MNNIAINFVHLLSQTFTPYFNGFAFDSLIGMAYTATGSDVNTGTSFLRVEVVNFCAE